MKKILLIFALILTGVIVNAQDDTIFHQSKYINLRNTEFLELYNNYQLQEGKTYKITFTADLEPSNTILLYLNNYMYYDQILRWDTDVYYDTMWTEDNHEKLAIDTILVLQSPVPVVEKIFHQGYNEFIIPEDIVHEIWWIAISRTDSIENQITLTDINLIEIGTDLEIINDLKSNVRIEATKDVLSFYGDYDILTIYNENNHKLISISNRIKSMDISSLERGKYIFDFDNNTKIIIIKK